jgi:hypothetical protein
MRTDVQMDGQTDMAKLIVAFPNLANAPKNENNMQNRGETLAV